MDAAKNFAKGTLTTGYDDLATNIVLNAGDGARFPAVPFNAVWWNATDYPDPADDPAVEIVRVTASGSPDNFTITRAQEGTTAQTHELEGKVYRLIAPLTAKVINDEMLPVLRTSSTNYDVNVGGNLGIDVGDGLSISALITARIAAQAPGMVMDISGTVAGLGDVDENNSGAAVLVDDNTGVVGHRGKIGTNQTAAATTLGSVTKKLEIFDNAGTSLGFIPIYGSIT